MISLFFQLKIIIIFNFIIQRYYSCYYLYFKIINQIYYQVVLEAMEVQVIMEFNNFDFIINEFIYYLYFIFMMF